MTALRKRRDTSQDHLYDAAVPEDADTGLIIDMYKKDDLIDLFDDTGNCIATVKRPKHERDEMLFHQKQNAFYGADSDDNTLSPDGYEEKIELVSPHENNDGTTEYHVSGKTKRWVPPTLVVT